MDNQSGRNNVDKTWKGGGNGNGNSEGGLQNEPTWLRVQCTLFPSSCEVLATSSYAGFGHKPATVPTAR